MNRRIQFVASVMTAAIASLSVPAAWAQSSHTGHEVIPMPAAQQADSMPMKGMDHSTMPGMYHSAPAKPQATATQDTRASQTAAPAAMDHGSMQMQGGSAPPDARDPHAYSGGYALGVGKYALGGQRQLRLADEHDFGSMLVDSLEWANAKESNSARYDVQAWFGRDYDRLAVKAEGDVAKGKLQDARTELLWGHAIATFWDTQLGIRQDSGIGPNRTWLAFGVQGLAPYWFDVDATAYVGNGGRTALRLAAEYDLLLTQKWVLQPRTEWNVYGKADPERSIGKGVSDGTVGLRLRYDVSRQFSPYVGVEWNRKFGQAADIARSAGESASATRWVAGVRFWF